jgi:hypothetical protein
MAPPPGDAASGHGYARRRCNRGLLACLRKTSGISFAWDAIEAACLDSGGHRGLVVGNAGGAGGSSGSSSGPSTARDRAHLLLCVCVSAFIVILTSKPDPCAAHYCLIGLAVRAYVVRASTPIVY